MKAILFLLTMAVIMTLTRAGDEENVDNMTEAEYKNYLDK